LSAASSLTEALLAEACCQRQEYVPVATLPPDAAHHRQPLQSATKPKSAERFKGLIFAWHSVCFIALGMPNCCNHSTISELRMGHFETPILQFATHYLLVFTGLLAIPCAAQPSGIVYTTTVPYTGMPTATGFNMYPVPTVKALTTDSAGNTYIAGAVTSGGLPVTPGVVQSQYLGGICSYGYFESPCPAAFVAKFDPNGKLLFLTYLGGTNGNVPSGLVVDQSGHIYVGIQAGPAAGESWVTQISPNGTGVGWVTFLSGALVQLAIGPDGSLYCLTQTSSVVEATLTELSSSGESLASFNFNEPIQAIAVGPNGAVYVGGQTGAPSIAATPGAWQTTFNGGFDGFLAKMNPSLTGFTWVTYVGGSAQGEGNDEVSLIQPAPDGSLWISGMTSDSGFPFTGGAFQQPGIPNGDSFYLVHLSSDGSQALASTYIPASLVSLAVDDSENVVFSTLQLFESSGFAQFQATSGAQWPCPQSGSAADSLKSLGFIGKIDSTGQHLLWGTWTGAEVPAGLVAVDKNGNALAAGNVPGQGNITLTAMTPQSSSVTLVAECIQQSAWPYASGPLAPGEIVSIYGVGFGPPQAVTAQPSGNIIGTDLAGVQVMIEGVPTPLLYVSSAQINFVAPYFLDGRSAAHIKLVSANQTSNQVILGVRASAPEIFLSPLASDGSPLAAVVNQDGTLNDQNHPAHVGDTVSLFVSGIGQTIPGGVDGDIPQSAGGMPALGIAVQLNTVYTNITYAGNAPGSVSGLTQINFQIPAAARVGAGPPYQGLIVLQAGGASAGMASLYEGSNLLGNAPFLWFE
jgi:uncharacterized protein (TIGR03437 family)